jgi:hypothetical protein
MSWNYVRVTDGHGKYRWVPFRYVRPAELDLMARFAGLRLRERWNGWTHEPFRNESRQHVSIWEKPTGSHPITRPLEIVTAGSSTLRTCGNATTRLKYVSG